jgi:hypothetical protein
VPEYRVTDKDGNEIHRGDIVTDFRGETATFRYVSRGPDIGKSAKVVVERVYNGPPTNGYGMPGQHENYAGVFDLTVTPLDD